MINATGLIWNWMKVGHLNIGYPIIGMNFFEFILSSVRQIASGVIFPRLLINMGIGVLMLTPFVRVLASMFYFAVVEHNWQYTSSTAFVLTILTYSLFLR